MIRTIVWFIYFWISLFASLPALAKVKRLDRENRIAERDAVIEAKSRKWSKSLLKLAGVNVTVRGEENLPKEGAILFVGNHQGNFDIPIYIATVPGMKGFVAKEELQKLPIVRDWMHYLNCVFLDRSNPRASLKAINAGIQHLKDGYSLVIFPEGTRSPDGKMAEFKPGSLRLATKSNATIVPVTINGTHRIMQKGSWIIRPAEIELVISPPVHPADFADKETRVLTDTVHDTIQSHLKL